MAIANLQKRMVRGGTLSRRFFIVTKVAPHIRLTKSKEMSDLMISKLECSSLINSSIYYLSMEKKPQL